MSKITASPNWRYKIKIKDRFEEESTPELIKELCKILEGYLRSIRDKVNNIYHIDDEERYYYTDKLEELIDSFEWLSKQDEPVYELEADFNGYLEELYDLADSRIIVNKVSEKFIWID